MTRFFIAAAVPLVFALLARAVRGVTTSGAIAGFVITFLLYAFAGPAVFAALVSVSGEVYEPLHNSTHVTVAAAA